MTSTTAALKDIRKLQRAIVDGLEDVKAQDIRVFNTEHLSPLFERVIVASGTSNRQTKALAASVRDAVREAGFDKPRTEGEENGEWIIVDCGQAVAHIMQPAIRQYYHLEEIWGEKPVRLRPGSPAPMPKPTAKPVAPSAGKPTGKATPKAPPKASPKALASPGQTVKKTASRKATATAAPKKTAAKKSPAKTSAASRPRTKT